MVYGGIAVDPTGDFWAPGFEVAISDSEGLRKFDSSGAQIGEIKRRGVLALAGDSAGNLFAVDNGAEEGFGSRQRIVEYDPSGAPIRAFAYGSLVGVVGGLAPYHSATGDIYASEREGGGRVLHLSFPPAGPLVVPEPCEASPLGNVKTTLRAEINPEGEAAAYHFELVDDATYQGDVTELGAGHGFDHATRLPEDEAEDPALPADFLAHKAAIEAPLVPETKYHCRVVATSAAAPSGRPGPEGTFTSLEALEIGSAWSSQVGTDVATLNAEVNPLGIPATGYFEYVEEATYQHDIAELGAGHGFDHALKAPNVDGSEEPIDFGAGASFKTGSAVVSGLASGTAYRFRILATNSLVFPKETPGATATLLTHRFGERPLPDQRRYELVSPAQKESAEVGVPGAAGGLFSENYVRIQAGAASGEALTYTSWTSFGNPLGAPGASQYLSRRGPGGWETENISSFGHNLNALPSPFRGFSPDLGFAGLMVSEPALTPEASTGFDNLYLRNNQTGALQALTISPPEIKGKGDFCLDYAGASADGSRAFFAANGAYPGAPEGEGFSLYEWSAAEGLKVLSILPGKSVGATPFPRTAFGAIGGHCGTGQTVVRNVFSSDGSRVFWTYEPNVGPTQLLVRIEGKETLQLDKGGEFGTGSGVFQAASTDGSKAFFTDQKRLKSEASEGGLYLYELPAKKLKILTPGSEAADVRGVIGASDDGSYVYFVASGVLAPGAKAGECGSPVPGKTCNLYLWHEGEGIRFIGILSAEDESSWDSAPSGLSARVSPSGRHLAFLSAETEGLAGYDNTITDGIHCRQFRSELGGPPQCPQAFLYDADTEELSCASCNPSGARPAGPAILPGWGNPQEGPHYLSDDGSRVFFESRDKLLPSDENDVRDVYEFEREGGGTCATSSPDFNPASGGCLFLISGGKSESESYLIDASSSGRDVFFSTRHSLVGWDDNAHYDIYDAREGGGFPEPLPAPPACSNEACKAPPSAPPSASPAATATFHGPGNVVEKPKSKKRKRKAQRPNRRHHHPRAHRKGRDSR
jgi:hypothetical protein